MMHETKLKDLAAKIVVSIQGQNWTSEPITEREKDVIEMTILYMSNNDVTNPEEIKVGDLVYLKSGSSKMVVTSVGETHCVIMFNPFGTTEILEHKIPYVALRKAQPR